MNVENLRDLLKHELQDLYDAESQILEALPKMIDKAEDSDLKKALQQHLEETRSQRERIEKAGGMVDVDVTGHKCKGIAGIIKEGEDLVKNNASDRDARDAAIIAAAQRVEHYEMAGYGTARTYARMLGEKQIASLLEETLKEEKSADKKLTEIAEDHVNRHAMASA